MVFAVGLVLWKKVASQNRLDAEQSEEVRRKTRTWNIFGLACSGEDEAASPGSALPAANQPKEARQPTKVILCGSYRPTIAN